MKERCRIEEETTRHLEDEAIQEESSPYNDFQQAAKGKKMIDEDKFKEVFPSGASNYDDSPLSVTKWNQFGKLIEALEAGRESTPGYTLEEAVDKVEEELKAKIMPVVMQDIKAARDEAMGLGDGENTG